MRTDWRALCEELADKLDHVRPSTFDPPNCLIRARAALAESVAAPAEPTDEAAVEAAAELIYMEAMEWAARQSIPSGHINIPAWQQGGNSDAQEVARRTARAALAAKPLVKGPTDEEIEHRFQVWWYDEGSGMPPGADEDPEAHVHRISQIAWHNGAYVARYGHQPAPPAEGDVAELVAALRRESSAYRQLDSYRDWQLKLTRIADLLERQAAQVLEPALARINDILNDSGRVCLADEREALELARQALEQRQAALAPVAVSERLPDTSDPAECRMPDGVCWWFDPHADADGAWVLDTYQSRYTHWLPFHDLPLPSGEVKA